MKGFGRGVRALRKRRDLSLEDLAVKARIPWAILAAIETGRRFPSLYELERLLDALEVNLNDVMGLDCTV
jgi:transcriptional regulator with XRE-family HTH domain